jgi:hypothetical protein
MKRLVLLIVITVLAYGYIQDLDLSLPGRSSSESADIALRDAHTNRQSDIQINGKGTVIKILSDDLDGSRHQRFILRLNSGQTVLVSHNIDLAPRINSLSPRDTVEFFGEYEWNSKGGVIYWTHHDPAGRHVAGWIKHMGKTYQ